MACPTCRDSGAGTGTMSLPALAGAGGAQKPPNVATDSHGARAVPGRGLERAGGAQNQSGRGAALLAQMAARSGKEPAPRRTLSGLQHVSGHSLQGSTATASRGGEHAMPALVAAASLQVAVSSHASGHQPGHYPSVPRQESGSFSSSRKAASPVVSRQRAQLASSPIAAHHASSSNTMSRNRSRRDFASSRSHIRAAGSTRTMPRTSSHRPPRRTHSRHQMSSGYGPNESFKNKALRLLTDTNRGFMQRHGDEAKGLVSSKSSARFEALQLLRRHQSEQLMVRKVASAASLWDTSSDVPQGSWSTRHSRTIHATSHTQPSEVEQTFLDDLGTRVKVVEYPSHVKATTSHTTAGATPASTPVAEASRATLSHMQLQSMIIGTAAQREELKHWRDKCREQLHDCRFSSPVLEFELLLRLVKAYEPPKATVDPSRLPSTSMSSAQTLMVRLPNRLETAVALQALGRVSLEQHLFGGVLRTAHSALCRAIFASSSLPDCTPGT